MRRLHHFIFWYWAIMIIGVGWCTPLLVEIIKYFMEVLE